MTLSTATASSSSQPESGGRRRSISGALTRRFTRNNSTAEPRSIPSKSASITKRRATIATTSADETGAQVHVRIVPNIENPSRSLIFDIVDRVLSVGSVIRIGRYSERHANLDCMSFKSKVVSRCHCEVWVETDGKLYIRDTKSSSGTFLNHIRLSPAGNESGPVELHDGDIVQLGVDFQGGREQIYRSVKMKFELNRSSTPRPLSFNLNAFQNLRNLTQQQQPPLPNHIITSPRLLSSSPEEDEQNLSYFSNGPHTYHTTTNNVQQKHPTATTNHVNTTTTNTTTTTTITTTISTNDTTASPAGLHSTNCQDDVDECCICLYALAPFQALFVSPCSHTYHFKCIRPLLQSYPGFQCPICRTYSDLEASVAMETDEVIGKYTASPPGSNAISITTAPLANSGLDLESIPSVSMVNHLPSHPDNASSLPALPESLDAAVSLGSSIPEPVPETTVENQNSVSMNNATICPENLPDNTPIEFDANNNHRNNDDQSHQVNDEEDHDGGIISNTDEEEDEGEQMLDQDLEHPTTATNVTETARQTTTTPSSCKRERRSSYIMEKIKMVFFEKKKSVPTQHNHKQRSNKNRQRPLSYPNMLSTVETTVPLNDVNNGGSSSTSPSNAPLSQTLSRQSTRHAASDDEDIPRPLMMII